MNTATAYSRAISGIQAPAIIIEVHLSNGLPSLSIVGMPETAVRESKDRVRSALLNAHYEFPQRRITVNLAPADLPKEGGRFDLPIALGILVASGQLPADCLGNTESIGELGLTGSLRPVDGILPTAIAASEAGHALILPARSAGEADVIENASLLPANHLLEICAHLSGESLLPGRTPRTTSVKARYPELNEVRGQHQARRALEIAAAGQHNVLMSGPPGAGKTMLASRLPGILPPMTRQEALESATVASISHHGFTASHWGLRPFRQPHHTASAVALAGGGSHPRPGEMSLAHNGVLFLDELPEFERRVLEVMREPLETGRLCISRSRMQVEFPARFQLIAAMNPCPCGYLGDPSGRCQCSPDQIQRYRARISGPLLDRIDILLEVPPLPHRDLLEHSGHKPESSLSVQARVTTAWQHQLDRSACANSRMDSAATEQHCRLAEADRQFLIRAMEQLSLSARSVHRILRVSRTIADLSGNGQITREHLAEAIALRRNTAASR